jgi:hypothetical protein
MKKTIKLTESDLTRIIEKVIKENNEMDEDMMDVSSDSEWYQKRKREVTIPFDDLAMLGHFATRFCESKEGLPDCQRVKEIYSKYNLFM